MQKPRSRGRVARVISGIAHASVFPLLALPLVSFVSECGERVNVTGYQALVGFKVNPADFFVDPSTIHVSPIQFGPDLWIALLLVVAAAGTAAAVAGGLRFVLARIGADVIGVAAVQLAITAYAPFQIDSPFSAKGYAIYVQPASAVSLITAVLVIAFIADAVSAARYWLARDHARPGGT